MREGVSLTSRSSQTKGETGCWLTTTTGRGAAESEDRVARRRGQGSRTSTDSRGIKINQAHLVQGCRIAAGRLKKSARAVTQ